MFAAFLGYFHKDKTNGVYLLLDYFSAILNVNTRMANWMKGPKWLWFILNSVFGIVIEEIEMAIKSYRPTAKFFNLQAENENAIYEDLTEEEKKIVKNFFDAREQGDFLALKMIHLESSVQLTFYLTLLVFSLHDVPLLDKNYKESQLNVASTKWILSLIWFILKTLLSGFSTFSPILKILKKDSYRITASAPSIVQYICVTINVLLDLFFAVGTTFLKGLTKLLYGIIYTL